MLSSRVVGGSSQGAKRAAAQILRSANASSFGCRSTFVVVQHIQLAPVGQRHFSSSSSPKIKEFFEQKTTDKVRKTPAAWEHPGMFLQHHRRRGTI